MYEDSYKLLKNSEFDLFDIYLEDSQLRLIEAKNKKIENIKIGYDSGVGIRATKGFSTLFSSTTDKNEKNVYNITKFMCDNKDVKNDAKPIRETEIKSIESYGGYNQSLYFVKDIFETLNTIAYKHKEIKQVSVTFSDKYKDIAIINESGNMLTERRVYTTLYIEMTAKKENVIQTWRKPFGVLGGCEFLKGLNFKSIAKEISEKLVELLWAPQPKASNMCVVLSSNAGGTMIHEAIGHGLEADLVYESLSVYKDKLNKTVANKNITVVDDARINKMRGSYFYDDEGEVSQSTTLLENGILKTYMFNKTYANAAHMKSTGNARRESFRFPPIVRMSNTFIKPGQYDPKDIITSVDDGLLVEHMGGGQVNPITGDFVFEVNEGYVIKNGKKRHMIRGATLIGNGPKLLETIEMVGNDFGTEVGTCGKSNQGVPVSDGEPTLKIPQILVGGRQL